MSILMYQPNSSINKTSQVKAQMLLDSKGAIRNSPCFGHD